ncbi:hypothetical protein P691DRAFT_832065 [Macrolepiota fuliginosa MF-IS2]|uniref:Nephrocystin 3-like N-terminal domain-containing protein n=1 Tax=Macrolepiota fuliginosa MF-IS2 TaxID=1400762 RepID=A0A9P6C1C3_9AGAR|nr:hypothetical protein P691DRAFT_832065 [Macrolepiota fuliginosa MF-IS2]
MFLALKWLEGHAMSGVEYHSSARNPPPRCYDGTRTELITMAERLLRDPNTKEKFLFLYGPAGVGKSAILQTLAERQAQNGTFGATLFLRRPSPPTGSLDDASQVWLTVSYRLATLDSSYLAYVNDQIKQDPKLVEANMQYQFQKLIAEPFGQKQLLSPSPVWPIFIDGWDQYHEHETQTQILQLIGKFISDYPSAPLVWIISSRPDRFLLKAVEEFSLQGHIKTHFVPVDSDDALADVKHYLQRQFSSFQKNYDITDPSPWPKEDDFGRIEFSVSGYFMIASAIAQFVGNREVADPMSQLETVLALSSEGLTPGFSHPFIAVHKLYMEILTTVSDVHYRTARRIIGFYLLPYGFGAYNQRSATLWVLCNILGIKQNVAYACLSKLRPLLNVPEPKDAFDKPIRFFHPSFADFLTNRDASERFWIDVKDVADDLWQCHCRILHQVNVPGTCSDSRFSSF